MSQSFRFLVHTSFQKQLDSFIETNTEAWPSLLTQIKKARSDPFKAGKAMHSIPVKKLQGRIYRLHVGGRRGYRFIYLVAPRQEVVLGIFVSSEVKARFDYEKVPWEEYAAGIYEDLINGNMGKFREMILPD